MEDELKKCYSIKYIIIGDTGVGKTNIIYRFINGEFDHNLQSTIGLEFSTKDIQIEDVIFHLNIFDTAGSEEFESLRQNYYNNAVCAIIAYDITKQKSFDSIDKWIKECEYSHNQDLIKVLVGNKSDLSLEGKRIISEEDGKYLAERYGIDFFFETSALTGNNIKNVFYESLRKAYELLEKNIDDEDGEIIKGISKYNGEIKGDLTVLNKEDENDINDKSSCPCCSCHSCQSCCII